MGEMGGPVERAYRVSVDDLREICSGLTDGKCEYKLTCDDEKSVAIAYNDGPDDLNSVYFTFPIVANLNVSHAFLLQLFGKQWPFGEDGLMVCLHIYTRRQTRDEIYLEDGELVGDFVEDWGKFWPPAGSSADQRNGMPGALRYETTLHEALLLWAKQYNRSRRRFS